MSTDAYINATPLDGLPRLDPLTVALMHLLTRADFETKLTKCFPSPLAEVDWQLGTPEILRRASGLNRPGMNLTLVWPSRQARIGIGIDTGLAHGLVDLMFGYARPDFEHGTQVTPVETGILTMMATLVLTAIAEDRAPGSTDDVMIDRIGPNAFDTTDLGSMMTVRLSVRLGSSSSGSVRVWLPEALVRELMSVPPREPHDPAVPESLIRRYGELGTVWRAEVGTSTFPRGLSRLRVGGVAPIDGSPLSGTPTSPAGKVRLVMSDCDGRSELEAEPIPNSGGERLSLIGPVRREVVPREPLTVNDPNRETPVPAESPASPTPPADVPVTLVVELGRLNMPLRRLADLKAGDVVELGRHAREPVELTSNGRLVARGVLVQIDTELGVRVTTVYL